MLDPNKIRADALAISIRAPSLTDAQTDDLAVALVSHLIDYDDALAQAFADAIDAPVYQPEAHQIGHLVPIVADFLTPRFGTAPSITIKQLAAHCYSLAVMKARGEA